MLFLSSGYQRVHSLTQMSHPPPFQIAPTISKTDRVHIKTNMYITMGKQSDEPQCFLALWQCTNLNKKLAVDFKIDHSTIGRDVFHHTVLLQLGKIMCFTNLK